MKTVDEIYRDLLAAYEERAGYAPEEGCELSVRLYAAAAQIQALSIQNQWVLDQSFPQTAEGEYLDHHAAVCGLSRIPAAAATGVLRFLTGSASAGRHIIETGTVCMNESGMRFVTVEDAVLEAGELYADAAAVAVEGGSAGNAAAGTVTVLTACPVGITGCTNPERFFGGVDAETDEMLRRRILDSYRRLPNGANAAWYEAAALGCEGAAAAVAVGRARGIGTVDVCVASAAGVPDEELLERVRSVLAEKREIAVDVAVVSPETAAVDVVTEIETAEGADFAEVSAAVEATLGGWFNGGLLGRPVRMAELGHLIYSVEGVENYHLLSPAEDLAATATVLPVAGTISVRQMGEV